MSEPASPEDLREAASALRVAAENDGDDALADRLDALADLLTSGRLPSEGEQ